MWRTIGSRGGLGVLPILGLTACGEPERATVSDSRPPAAAPAKPTDTPPAAPVRVEPRAVADTATITLQVYFTRDERPVAVTRRVPRTDAVLRAALEELLEGPTAAERAAGLSSFFSSRTAGMLDDVALDAQGHATVDFADFSRLIPNASTSTGSFILLGELNRTVFQFPSVRSVTYRFEGSCDAFWNWIQRSCQVVTRHDAGSG